MPCKGMAGRQGGLLCDDSYAGYRAGLRYARLNRTRRSVLAVRSHPVLGRTWLPDGIYRPAAPFLHAPRSERELQLQRGAARHRPPDATTAYRRKMLVAKLFAGLVLCTVLTAGAALTAAGGELDRT